MKTLPKWCSTFHGCIHFQRHPDLLTNAILSLYYTQGQWANTVNTSYVVLYFIVSLLLLLFCSFATLTHHLVYLSISSPWGPMFSQIPLMARTASALACSPTFVSLASSLCLDFFLPSFRLHLSHLGLGGLSCPNNTNRSLRKEERGGQRRRQGGVKKMKETKRQNQK